MKHGLTPIEAMFVLAPDKVNFKALEIFAKIYLDEQGICPIECLYEQDELTKDCSELWPIPADKEQICGNENYKCWMKFFMIRAEEELTKEYKDNGRSGGLK